MARKCGIAHGHLSRLVDQNIAGNIAGNCQEKTMQDLAFVSITIAFFLLGIAYSFACAKL